MNKKHCISLHTDKIKMFRKYRAYWWNCNPLGWGLYKNITFRYGTRRPVLEHITMNIKHGQKVALVGESGSSKTTLVIKMLDTIFAQ